MVCATVALLALSTHLAQASTHLGQQGPGPGGRASPGPTPCPRVGQASAHFRDPADLPRALGARVRC
jgi:hypothetical protein